MSVWHVGTFISHKVLQVDVFVFYVRYSGMDWNSSCGMPLSRILPQLKTKNRNCWYVTTTTAEDTRTFVPKKKKTTLKRQLNS